MCYSNMIATPEKLYGSTEVRNPFLPEVTEVGHGVIGRYNNVNN